ncbi:hypothetical protein TNCT_735381 [Trichonephila clavata]|uniref:Uncharacterized protein n=1 Tax=Trichonephila clavata TaxID=2740835 RepID=A0A8X6HXR0_TRICU|nr:hypothetical protein TNCT_735381 [Trichonephila clavata]
MRDDLAFAHCLVKYSSPDFGEFAAFLKEFRNRLNALPIPEVLTVQDFRRHFHDLDALCNVLCPSGNLENCALSPFSALSNLSNPRTLCSTRWLKGSRRLHSGHLDRMYETRSVPKGDRGLVLWGLAGFGTMGDAGSYGSATFVQCSLSRSRVWRA